ATGAALAIVLVAFVIAKARTDNLLVAPEVGEGDPKELELFALIAATVVFGGIAGSVLAYLSRRFAPCPAPTFMGFAPSDSSCTELSRSSVRMRTQ
ncbi:MAG: phosphotransferase system glucose/maltose/N-acetylglucosamine-specific IIC component, partial [Myxococcota bacterium]